VAFNFSDAPIEVPLGPLTVEVSSDAERTVGAGLEAALEPFEAAVLRPSNLAEGQRLR
jgi:hypothetical protein